MEGGRGMGKRSSKRKTNLLPFSLYLVKIEDNSAEYEVITTRNGKIYSFHLLFVRNTNGLWKIKRF